MAVTWLHISDLHVRGGDSYDRSVVFSALVRSVRRFREKENRAPDLVFATGDIAFSGRSEEYTIASEFFDQLLEAAGLERRWLFVIPGNHDVDRTIAAAQLKRELKSSNEVDTYFNPANREPMLHLTLKQSAFIRWHDGYFQGIRRMPDKSTCGPVELVQVKGQGVAILPVNTALFAQDRHDFERLFVGRPCLAAAIEKLNRLDAHLKIALMHHPIHYLSSLERQNIRANLVDNLDVILGGHLHEAGYFGVDMITGRNLYCQAGATYQTRGWPNRAYYATFHQDQVTVFPIRYEDQPREVWTLDTSLFPDAPGYERRFPLPRDPAFRSFRNPLWDGLYRVPSRRAPFTKKRPLTEEQPAKVDRTVAILHAMETNVTKQRKSTKRSRKKASGKKS